MLTKEGFWQIVDAGSRTTNISTEFSASEATTNTKPFLLLTSG
jgi:hypothetical protein